MNVWIAVQKHAGGLSRICNPSSNVQIHIPHYCTMLGLPVQREQEDQVEQTECQVVFVASLQTPTAKTKHKDMRPKQVKNVPYMPPEWARPPISS